jgi:hypothetical protein
MQFFFTLFNECRVLFIGKSITLYLFQKFGLILKIPNTRNFSIIKQIANVFHHIFIENLCITKQKYSLPHLNSRKFQESLKFPYPFFLINYLGFTSITSYIRRKCSQGLPPTTPYPNQKSITKSCSYHPYYFYYMDYRCFKKY